MIEVKNISKVFNHPKSDRVREFFAKINRMVEPEYSI